MEQNGGSCAGKSMILFCYY